MIKVNNYTLRTNKIKKDLDILVISDLHNKNNYLNSVNKYLKKEKINLDYILMPGDILDRHNLKNEDEFIDEIINLSKNYKIIMALGNHDRYDKNDKNKMLNDIEYIQTNFYNRINNNDNIIIGVENFKKAIKKDNICISILNLNNKYYSNHEKINDFKEYIKEIDKNNKLSNKDFNILLVHSPNCLIENKKIINYSNTINNSNLILCGHNHAGLIPTFIQDKLKNGIGLIGPFNTFFPKNSYGIFSNSGKNLLISNGLTKVSDISIFKFFNKILIPEIDLIHIKKTSYNNFKLNNRKKYRV